MNQVRGLRLPLNASNNAPKPDVSEDQDAAITFSVEPLAKRHQRDGFSCGAEPLDRYLNIQASQDQRRRFAAPYVAVTDNDIVVAYYSLSSFRINQPDLPGEERKKLPGYPNVPATLLGRLAVDQKYHGRGIGEHMLLHALKRSNDLSCEIASYAIVVDAKDDAAIAFYQHFNFLQFPSTSNRLYLPVKQLAKLF